MSAFDKLATITVGRDSFKDTAQKDYQRLQSFTNATSYSMLQNLHSCPRKFQLIKAAALRGEGGRQNVDFAYGHAVGSGVQAWLMTKDMNAALFNALMAWRIPFEASIPKKNKTIWDTWLAVKSFVQFYQDCMSEWDVLVLPNGKQAVELAAEIDFENGYKHYLHIDVILKHRITGQLAIQENKTHGFVDAESAIYANSDQALGYSLVIDMLQEDTSYEVFYVCYSAPSRKWQLLPFTKSTTMKAEFLNSVQLDHASIETYRQMNFYPKRGDSCYDFMRPCEFFGSCNLTSNLNQERILPADQSAEEVDYSFKLSQLQAAQLARLQTQPQGVTSGHESIVDPEFNSIDLDIQSIDN